MSAIPKLPSADRRQGFRSRLQRALSLSPAESEDARSHSGSVAGDTTEEEEVHQEENDCPRPRGWGTTLGSIEEDARQDWNTGPNLEKELKIPGQPDVSSKCNMIALQCIAELDTRTNPMQNSLGNQTTWNETIRSDLEEICSPLAAVEAAIEVTTKAGENTAAEGKATGRTHRC